MVKRLFSLLLTAIMLCCVSAVALADEENPIIIVPGLGGSKLFADAELSDRVYGGSIDYMSVLLSEHEGFFVKQPVNLQKAAEYGAGNSFKTMANTLCSAYPKRKIYFFSYDFTVSTVEPAAALGSFIDSLGGKADIICFSMGGIVTTRWLAMNANNINKTGKIICLGVPFEGAVGAQYACAAGIRYVDGIRELLPTERYCEKMKTDYREITDMCGKADQSFLLKDGAGLMAGYGNTFFAFGAGRLTPSITAADGDGISALYFDNTGDGVVTSLSATMLTDVISKTDESRYAYFDVSHNGLIESRSVIEWISEVLDGKQQHRAAPEAKPYTSVTLRGIGSLSFKSKAGELSDSGMLAEIGNSVGSIYRLGDVECAALSPEECHIRVTGTKKSAAELEITSYDKNNKPICEKTVTDLPLEQGTVVNAVAGAEGESWIYLDKEGDGVMEEAVLIDEDSYSFKTSAPVPSAKPGTYGKHLKLELATDTENARILFTTDGGDPKKSGTVYSGELEISDSATLKMIAVRDNYFDSDIVTAEYVISDKSVLPYAAAAAVILLAVAFLLLRKRNGKKEQSI